MSWSWNNSTRYLSPKSVCCDPLFLILKLKSIKIQNPFNIAIWIRNGQYNHPETMPFKIWSFLLQFRAFSNQQSEGKNYWISMCTFKMRKCFSCLVSLLENTYWRLMIISVNWMVSWWNLGVSSLQWSSSFCWRKWDGAREVFAKKNDFRPKRGSSQFFPFDMKCFRRKDFPIPNNAYLVKNISWSYRQHVKLFII